MKLNQHPDDSYPTWRRRLYEIIFEADTRAGKLFDVVLLILIILSVVVICVESLFEDADQQVEPGRTWLPILLAIEWALTVLFTIEYIARIVSVRRPRRYIFSFFGVIDLLSILPTYLGAFLGYGNSLAVFRAIRLLRVFRVLKLVWLLSEANELGSAVWESRGKIVVFFSVVVIAVTIAGAVMHELEPETFTSIPQAIYWSIVTMTTVGYGDLVPRTALGQAFSAILILLGYSLIIVPTGFVSAEFAKSAVSRPVTTRVCGHCMTEGHDPDALYCKYCSTRLVSSSADARATPQAPP